MYHLGVMRRNLDTKPLRTGLTAALVATLCSISAVGDLTPQGAKLVGSGATGAAWQASAVAVSADGNTAVVGGYLDNSGAGAAWVFTRAAGAWTQQGAKLVGTSATGPAGQGSSVAVSGDGNTVMVGGPGDNSGVGAAWVFTRSAGVWTQTGAKLVASGAAGNANQGWAVALSSDGNTAIVGGPGDNTGVGAAWVFSRTAGAWKQQGGKLVGTGAAGPAGQGTSVALSGDAGTLIVGAPSDNSNAGAVWVFTQAGGKWTQQGNKLTGSTPTSTFSIQGDAAVTATFTQQPPSCVTLAVAVSPSSEGTITINTPQTCTGGFLPGTQVSLTVTPVLGWALSGWTGSGGSFSNVSSYQTTFAITGVANVTANLVQQTTTCETLSLVASPAASGSVTVGTIENCTGGYTQGLPILLTANPAFGWTFAGWSASGGVFANASSPTAIFTITENATVTATFTTPSGNCASLTVAGSPAGAGGVAVGTAPNCGAGYAIATPIALTANPAPGWTFAGWSGSGGAFANPAGLVPAARQGAAVAASGDGNTAIVGGNVTGGSSTVWVFVRNGGTWLQQGNPLSVAGDAGSGQPEWSVALTGDGNTALVGEPGDNRGTGAAWVFVRSGGAWTQQGTKLVGAGASGPGEQGFAVALSADAGTAVVGGPNDGGGAGAAWVFASGGAPPTCTFALTPQAQSLAQVGGRGGFAVSVVSGSGCPWVSVSNVPWINVVAGANGTDNGQVTYAASTNVGLTRSGTVTAAGQTFTVNQAGTECSYALGPTSATFPEGGGNGSFDVSTSTECPWAAAGTAAWLHVTGAASVVGSGSVAFTVDANTAGARTARIAVGSAAFTVNQAAYVPPLQAAFSLEPSSPLAGELVQFSDTSGGAPTSWSWEFGDGGTSQLQNPEHTYAAAGSYTVTLTVADAAAQSGASHQVDVGAGTAVWVPVVSHVGGTGGTVWRSDAGLLNPGTVAASAQALFYGPAGVVTGVIEVPAGGQVVARDVVAGLGAAGSGALEIVSDQPLVVTSRTYDQLASGTVGQGYASSSAGGGLAAGGSAWLPQLTENAAYRTNISLTNTGASPAEVTVALFDANGSALGSYDVTLGPGGWAQDNRSFAVHGRQAAMDEGYAKVTVVSGAGVIATASVIDNVTDDPTTVAMVPAASPAFAKTAWVPVVSHVGGTGGTVWRSDAGLLNPGTVAASAQALFYGPAGVVTGVIGVPAGGQVVARDVVAGLGAAGSGALEIVSDQPLVVTSRTYDQLASGTVGQGYASSSAGGGLAAGGSAWLPQLTENAAYRTNISLTNTGASPAEVTVALFDANGSALGSYDVTLGPGGWAQDNRSFAVHGRQAAMDEGYAKVTVVSGAGVIATASVIDNVTDDPTTVAMVP